MGVRKWIFRSSDRLKGEIKVGRSTKQLTRGYCTGQIVVIDHKDLDEVAAVSLIEAKVKAVINAAPTMTGSYPIHGPLLLLRAGISIYEIEDTSFQAFKDHMQISIDGEYIYADEHAIPCVRFTEEKWAELYHKSQHHVQDELSKFIDNTIFYAQKEKDFVLQPLNIPPLRTAIEGKHVVIVVRGNGYKHDLQAIKDYIDDYRPILIGVDGGADALLMNGHMPDMIVGDMDSASDEALLCGAELVVHAYPDGRAPGMERIRQLGLHAKSVPAPGTSEDIAMLIAYENKAELIVTLGAHTHMLDFLEKGRKGMASTWLVRMKVGDKLIDAKGLSKLYRPKFRWKKLRNGLLSGALLSMMLYCIRLL